MLGTKQKDIITGFTGVVTGVCQYLSGCSQALLTPSQDASGTFPDGKWFDLQRLEQVGEDIIVLDNGATPGFDAPAPIR